MSVRILIGDMRERLKEVPDASVDSCVCDPPYHLTSIVKRFGAANAAPAKVGKTGAYARASRGFMGQTWDGGDVAFDPATWAEVLRVLKPGAHLVAFSGTRTYHRMVCAIEDAGFEVRDSILDIVASDDPVKLFLESLDGPQTEAFFRCIEDSQFGGLLAWIYGSGFPKSHNQPGGWGTALKPAWEPICLARKPLVGTVAANLLAHGTGAINIDGCRIETDESLNGGTYSGERREHRGEWQASDRSGGKGSGFRNGAGDFVQPPGRWPANIIHDGSEEVLAAFPDAPGQQGDLRETGRDRPSSGRFGDMAPPLAHAARLDSGSAARFFYCAKTTTAERGEGNNHPTVKPVDLMRWLCRLVTPKGGTVLDPFAGSGSTLIAADAECFDAIGCELSHAYVEIAERRIRDSGGMFADVMVVPSAEAAA